MSNSWHLGILDFENRFSFSPKDYKKIKVELLKFDLVTVLNFGI